MKLLAAALLTVTVLLIPAVANAQDCPIKDFTVQDVQAMNASDVTKLVAYSISDKSTSDKSNANAGAEFVIYGTPVKLSYAEAKDWAQHVLEESGYNLEKEKRMAVAQAVLSPVAAGMYADCIGAQHFKVQPLASSAITDSEFTVNLQWKPGVVTHVPQPLHVTVTNGNVEHETPLIRALLANGTASLKIKKQGKPGDTTTVSIAIGSDTFPTIEVPIYSPLKKYDDKWISGTSSVKSTSPSWATCDKSTTLRSGPHYDSQSHSCTLCVNAEDGTYLFPKTTELTGTVVGASETVLPGADSSHVCARFDVAASGNTGESNYLIDGALKVRAAVLRK